MAELLDTVAIGVGYDQIGQRSGSIKRAKVRYAALTKIRSDVARAAKRITLIEQRSDAIAVVGTLDWPEQMEELLAMLTQASDTAGRLQENYKRLSHASRKVETDEWFLWCVESMRENFKLTDSEIAVLLSAGYEACDNPQDIGAKELRERLKSAKKLRAASEA